MPGAGEPGVLGAAAALGFSGTIDLDGTSSGAVWTAGQHGNRNLSTTAAQLNAGADCDVAAQGAVIAVVRGTPYLDGRPGESLSAAQLIAIYADQGAACIEHLRGRHAIALIDLQRRKVVLAVDRFAVFPVCWSAAGARISFSDRADTVPGSGLALAPQALFDYLYFHAIAAPRTVFAGVRRLAAAERLVATADKVEVARYWTPRFVDVDPTHVREREERFRSVLASAVARCRSGSTGAYLSGGTDSSTIAGLLARASVESIPAYSIGFDAEGFDEMSYAAIAARHFGLQHHPHYLTPAELVAAIPAVAAHFDQPFGNSSVVPAFRCAQLAAADGVQTLLAGDGGDELFGGNTRYARQNIFAAYTGLPVPMRTMVDALASARVARSVWPLRKLASYVEQARVPMPARAETYNLLNRLGATALLAPELLESVDIGEPARHHAMTWAAIGDDVTLVNRMLAYDWQHTLADSDLPKVCMSAALAGVAVAFPMLDDDVVDFSIELPAKMKVRGLRLRPFFKRALRNFLPRDILRKRKHGFGMPFGPWLLRDVALGALVDDRLASLATRRIFAPGALQTLRTESLPAHPGYYGEMIWLAVMLEEWLRLRAPQFTM